MLLGGVLIFRATDRVLAARSDQIDKELDDIVVTAPRTGHTLADTPEATIVINAEEIAMQNASDALEALRWLPGIVVNPAKMGGGLVIDGYKSSFTSVALVLIDGNRTQFSLSEIPANIIERIEVIKGANAILYGSDAMSCVINVITKKAPDRFTASLRGTYSANKILQKIPRSSPAQYDQVNDYVNSQGVSVGFKLGKLRQSYVYDRKHIQGNRSDKHDSFLARFGMDLTDNTQLGFDVRVNQNERTWIAEHTDNYEYALNFGWTIDENSSLKTRILIKDDETTHNIDRRGVREKSLYDEEEIAYTRRMGKNLLTAGYQRTGNRFDSAGPGDNWVKEEDANNLFIQDEITLTDSLVLEPGARMEFYRKYGEEFNPKISVLWKATDSLNLRVSWGTSFKAPSFTQLYQTLYFSGLNYLVRDNPDLQPQHSQTIRISAEKRFGNRLNAYAGLFRNDFEDMIKWASTEKYTPEGEYHPDKPTLIWEYRNVNEAWVQGVETEIKCDLTDTLSASLGYSYSHGEEKQIGKKTQTLNNAPQHKFSPMIRYHNSGIGLTADLRGEYERYPSGTVDKDGDKENFTLHVSMNKNITDYAKIWVRAYNLLNEGKRFGLAESSGRELVFGLEFTY